MIEHVIAGGVHGILSLGTNGEFYGLDPEQQERAVTITIDQAAGRVPVYMGIGAISTKECVKLAAMGERIRSARDNDFAAYVYYAFGGRALSAFSNHS